MKLKNEQEIKTLSKESWDEWKSEDDFEFDGDYYKDGYSNGYSQAQQDLLSQASENFNQWIYKYPDKCDLRDFEKPNHHYFVAEEAWQASRLSMAKEMQERDAEIEELKKDLEWAIDELDGFIANGDCPYYLENIKSIKDKWFKGEAK